MVWRFFQILWLCAATALPAWAEPPHPVAAAGKLMVDGQLGCGAALVAADLVLTAGHCANHLRQRVHEEPGVFQFLTGEYPGKPAAQRAVTEIVVHPLFRIPGLRGFERIRADIALLRLASAIPAEVAAPFDIATQDDTAEARLIAAIWDMPGPKHANERGCTLLHAQDWLLTLGCNVISGHSGSPILALTEAGPKLVGVVSARAAAGRQPLAFAVLAQPRLGQLKALMPPEKTNP